MTEKPAETVVFRIHHTPKDVYELFKKTKKKFENAAREEKTYASFNWGFRDQNFKSFAGEIFSQVFNWAETKGIKDITLIKAKSKTVIGFFGTPEQCKEKLEKILDELIRKEKLKSFK